MTSETKRLGTVYEHMFIVRALQEGFDPHMSVGDFLPHDIVVTNGAGHAFRVQVKGTAKAKAEDRQNPRYRITTRVLKGTGNKAPLDCTKVDVMAAYIEPADAWYMIPCLKIRSRSTWFYPHTEGGSKGYYEQFREDWDYFR